MGKINPLLALIPLLGGGAAGMAGQGLGQISSLVNSFASPISKSLQGLAGQIYSGIKGAETDLAGSLKNVFTPQGNGQDISGFNIPGLQYGGYAEEDKPYIVGENGPELFVPGTTGYVEPYSTETADSIRALYSGYKPPTTPTGQPSIAEPVQTTPAWTEIPPPGMSYSLARGLGAAAAAIAPRSIGGRMGAAAAGLASQDEANRLQRIRMGSTIQEAQSRTGLAEQLMNMRREEQQRKIASGQKGSSWMRTSGFTKELDKSIGIEGAGEMMALAVENGLFPVHELFSLRQGKDVPVPIEAWSYFGMDTPPDELAQKVGWKTFLEIYKGQKEKSEKTPTPSMYEDVPVGKGDMMQKMKWNPDTHAHDIPVGPPRSRSVAQGRSPDFAKTLYLAAKSVGVEEEDLKAGKVTPAQADAILKKMAPMNIWSLLMSGGAANVPKVDKEGNEIK